MMTFEMNGIKWKIFEASQAAIKQINNSRAGDGEKDDVKDLKSRYYGITFVDLCKIYIDEDLPQDRKRRTLIHELTHCYIVSYITHQDKNYGEEMVADIVSNSHDTIRKIVDKYFEKDEVINEHREN